jgi:hypothetical protein
MKPEDTVREALEYANGLIQTGTTVYIGFPKALSALSALVAERDALRKLLLEIKQYTAPWAIEEVKHPEVFRKAMLNINEDVSAALGGEAKEIGKQN